MKVESGFYHIIDYRILDRTITFNSTCSGMLSDWFVSEIKDVDEKINPYCVKCDNSLSRATPCKGFDHIYLMTLTEIYCVSLHDMFVFSNIEIDLFQNRELFVHSLLILYLQSVFTTRSNLKFEYSCNLFSMTYNLCITITLQCMNIQAILFRIFLNLQTIIPCDDSWGYCSNFSEETD